MSEKRCFQNLLNTYFYSIVNSKVKKNLISRFSCHTTIVAIEKRRKMGCTPSTLTVEELNEFRKLNPDTTDIEIPASSKNRTITDKKGFIIVGIVFLIFLPFFIYTLVKSDIRRLTRGVDECGNLCGIANLKIDGISCSGKDYTNKPYHFIHLDNNKEFCSSLCPSGKVGDGYFCYDPKEPGVPENFKRAWDYTQTSWWKFIIIILITIVLSVVMLSLFRFIPKTIVWGILIFGILFIFVLTGIFWAGYFKMKSNEPSRGAVLAGAILFTIFTAIASIILLILFKRIKMIVSLFKETAKAIFAMPRLILLPVIRILFQLIVLVLVVTTTIWMATAKNLVKVNENDYEFVTNGAMIFTMIFNIAITIWVTQFLVGCQYMITAGSVATWYFSRNRLYSPILTNIRNTIQFHLGTIALGSFILTLISVIKFLIKSLVRNDKLRWIVDCCFSNIEMLLKFFSKNAYIETAIHGRSFCKSGMRAAKLLLSNASSLIAINSVGDFVLGMTQLILITICTGIAYALFSESSYWWMPILIALSLNLVIVLTIFSVFETTVDTLFICFCEDKVLNDGISKPYFMSTDLMQFVENSKQVYKEKK